MRRFHSYGPVDCVQRGVLVPKQLDINKEDGVAFCIRNMLRERRNCGKISISEFLFGSKKPKPHLVRDQPYGTADQVSGEVVS